MKDYIAEELKKRFWKESGTEGWNVVRQHNDRHSSVRKLRIKGNSTRKLRIWPYEKKSNLENARMKERPLYQRGLWTNVVVSTKHLSKAGSPKGKYESGMCIWHTQDNVSLNYIPYYTPKSTIFQVFLGIKAFFVDYDHNYVYKIMWTQETKV